MKYFWKHCYGIGSDIHWALCDEESDKENKVTDHLLVLFATEPKCLDGQPLSEQDMPKRIIDLLNNDQQTREELRQVYKTLGRMCELSDIVCSWVEKRNRIPSDVQTAVKEIMQYVEQVRP